MSIKSINQILNTCWSRLYKLFVFTNIKEAPSLFLSNCKLDFKQWETRMNLGSLFSYIILL